MTKIFVDESEHILDGYRLGTQIYASGFRPSFIVGLWRGGSTVGIVVQECLATLGVETDHIALRTSYEGRAEYESTAKLNRQIRVHGKQYLLESMNCDDRLLIVDDVFSSGRHTRAVIDALKRGLKRNMPGDVRVASIWLRGPTGSEESEPDFYLHTTRDWVVLPFEVQGLSAAEMDAHKPYLKQLLPSDV
ncbi:MAG: hypoxanthine phosphoribosyltransferase [Pseudomonadota bacterium]